MAINKRQIQEINAGSMADIAFLLLIFFLVATTMNTDTGLGRMLPPMPPEDQKQEDIKVKERNLFLILVSGSGSIMAGPQGGEQDYVSVAQLKDLTKDFILNVSNSEELPEKKDKEIELPDGTTWVYPVSEGVISLQTTRDTNYDIYIQVQNELTRAFNEIRDAVAMQKFGVKFAELQKEEAAAVSEAVPPKISEAEPRITKK